MKPSCVFFGSTTAGINMSLSTVKRRFKELNVHRKSQDQVDGQQLKGIIEKELDGPSCLSGYCSMTHVAYSSFKIHDLIWAHSN